MRAIYRYTLFKYLKSPSTWVILLFASVGLGFILGGVLFSVVNLGDPSKQLRNYVSSSIAIVAGVTVFMTIFASVFAGFKAASMYKDEVENGTFLIILSKPIRRSTIIFGKWFALQTLLIAYSFISVFTFCVAIAIFDRGKTISSLTEAGFQPLSSQIANVGGFAFLIVYVASLIFSSIALLLSTKLPVSTTVGILIALGVVIPITSLLSILLRKPPVDAISSPSYLTTLQNLQTQVADLRKQADRLVAGAGKSVYPNLENQLDTFNKTAEASSIYNMALTTNEKDTYRSVWWLDFNFQFSTLAEFAYEKAIPFDLRNQLLSSTRAGANVITTPKLEIDAIKSQANIMRDLDKYYAAMAPLGSAVSQLTVLNFLFQIEQSKEFFASTTEQAVASMPIRRDVLVQTANALEQYREASGATVSARFAKLQAGINDALNQANRFDDEVKISYLVLQSYLAYLFDLPTPSEFSASNNQLGLVEELQKFNLYEFLNYRISADASANRGSELLAKNTLSRYLYTYLACLSRLPKIPLTAISLLSRTSLVLYSATNPLFSVFNTSAVQSFVNNDLNQDQRLRLLDVQTKLNDSEANSGDFPTALKVPLNDVALVEGMLSAAAVNRLVTYTSGPYVNKNWLLAGYIIVALILAPITYPIIRRQDFR